MSARIQSGAYPLTGADGLPLAMEARGDPGAPGILFAHGFGQTRHAWSRSADNLAQAGFSTVTFDARGHGDSGRASDGAYHIDRFLDDLARIAQVFPQPPALVGASMGGLLGLSLAGEADPPPFRALVLVDITPRWEPAGVTRMLGFMRAHPGGFADIDAAIDAVTIYLPHRARKRAHELAPLLRRAHDGRLHWHWDPAMLHSIAAEGERHQPRLLAAARRIRIPVLLLSGGRSDVVSRDTIDEFLALLPHARHVELPGATHMLTGDDNDAFTSEIKRFLATLPQALPSAGDTGWRRAPGESPIDSAQKRLPDFHATRGMRAAPSRSR